MRIKAKALLLVALLSGCQHVQLERHTLRQAGTLTDLQYQQVLSNLALMHCNPGALPYYSLAGTGQTNVQLNVSATTGFNWDLLTSGPHPFLWYWDKASAGGGGMETALDQWTTASVLNPDELSLMRAAYQRTLGEEPDPDVAGKLEQYFADRPSYLAAMQPGWVHFGGEHDVPRKACFVGHYCKCYAWVGREGLDDLTHLTLAILDIGTALAGASTGNVPSGHIAVGQQNAIKALQEDAYKAYVAWSTAKEGQAAKRQAFRVAVLKLLQALHPDTLLPPPPTAPDGVNVWGPEGTRVADFHSEVNRLIQEEQRRAQQQTQAAPFFRPRKPLYNSFAIPTVNFP